MEEGMEADKMEELQLLVASHEGLKLYSADTAETGQSKLQDEADQIALGGRGGVGGVGSVGASACEEVDASGRLPRVAILFFTMLEVSGALPTIRLSIAKISTPSNSQIRVIRNR
ncbi:uncharacterized protein A4U43_C04F17190 [Asparagus officinalis]|uniref:Uncharacterized protein n=1 Tax=Asparagus officinalis TaxID=4686 RepID=A0A5P1F6V8_ASPOF|nr:uncharacterized protein A4U43_C04F17190 [Asparagus officinalis]